MYTWDVTLAEIRYPLVMISHELQEFKLGAGLEVACHQWSPSAETGIQILSLRALVMEIGSYNLF
jgi:hypothetical protein